MGPKTHIGAAGAAHSVPAAVHLARAATLALINRRIAECRARGGEPRPLTAKKLAKTACWWGRCEAPCVQTVVDLTHGYTNPLDRYAVCAEHGPLLEAQEATTSLPHPYLFLPAGAAPDEDADDGESTERAA